MAAGRPSKNNVDYFPHFNNLRNHRKVRAIRNKFGQALGLAFWCLILEWLIEHDGLEFEYSDMEVEMLSVELDISAAELREMVDYCVKLEMLFLTDSNFLYSDSLNEKLSPVFEKRNRERERSLTRKRRENGQFQPKKGHTTGVSAAEKPQSKVKKSKEEKSKLKSTNVDKRFCAVDFPLPFESIEFRQVWELFCQHRINIRNELTEQAAKLVVGKLSKEPEYYAIAMIEKTIESGKWPSIYPLKDWEKERINDQRKGASPPKRRYLNANEYV